MTQITFLSLFTQIFFQKLWIFFAPAAHYGLWRICSMQIVFFFWYKLYVCFYENTIKRVKINNQNSMFYLSALDLLFLLVKQIFVRCEAPKKISFNEYLKLFKTKSTFCATGEPKIHVLNSWIFEIFGVILYFWLFGPQANQKFMD